MYQLVSAMQQNHSKAQQLKTKIIYYFCGKYLLFSTDYGWSDSSADMGQVSHS